MEETEDSAGKEHLKVVLKKGRCMSCVGRKIVDDSKAGAVEGKKVESQRRGSYCQLLFIWKSPYQNREG